MQETWFSPWVRKIPGRRKWQPTPVFLPGEFHGQRSLVGCRPWIRRVRYNWMTDTHTKCQLKWRQFENSKNLHCCRAPNFKESLPVSLQREEKCMIIILHRHFWGSTINQAEKLARYSHLMKLESVHCNGWDQVKTFMKRSRPWRERKDRTWDPFKLA